MVDVTCPRGELNPPLARPVGERGPRFAGEPSHVHQLRMRLPAARLDARQVQEIVHEAMHPARIAQYGPGEALDLGSRARLGRERFGVSGNGREGCLELVGHVGDEVATHGLEASQLGHVADHQQPASVRQRAPGDEQRAPDALQFLRLRLFPAEHGRHQVAGRLLVEQLGERRKGIVGSVSQETPGRSIESDDRAAGVRRHHAVGHSLDQRIGEALIELLVHRPEREDVVGDLGDVRIGKGRRPAVRDRAGGATELHEGLGDLPGEQPGQGPGDKDRRQSHERHGALHGADLLVHGRECGRHPDHGKVGGAGAHGDIHPALVGGCTETLRATDARGQRLLDLGTQQVVLESIQRRAVELGVASDPAGGIDEGHSLTDAGTELAGELGPAQ